MEGLLVFPWPARNLLARRTALLLLAAIAGAFIAANVFAFHLGAAAGRAAATAPGPPAAISPPADAVDTTIRVLLIEQVSTVRIGLDAPFRIVDPEDRRVLCESPPLDPLTIRFDAEGVSLPELDQDISRRVIDLVPSGQAAIRISMPRGERAFRGSLRLLSQASAGGAVINLVDMESYLRGVVPAEALPTFHTEALRVQAIIARTYAWYARLTIGAAREWDVWSTEASQMYTGLSNTPGAAEQAVEDTRGIVCTWRGPEGERIFCTYYSSTCGGSTQNAGPVKNEPTLPPLAGGVRCEHCAGSPFYRWEPVRLEKSHVTQQLRQKYAAFRKLGRIESMEVIDATPEGRPVRFALSDKNGRTVELEAENFRLSVDPTGRQIRSTFFVPLVEPDAIVLTGGRGFGHGMGLCQYGAAALADAGWPASRILALYYPGSHITRAY